MGTYGLRVPAFRVGYVAEAQGGLPPGPRVLCVLGTRTSLGRTVRTAYRGTPGYPGHAIVMEISGHRFDPAAAGKTLAPFAPALEGGINGDPAYFAEQLLPLCPRAGTASTLVH